MCKTNTFFHIILDYTFNFLLPSFLCLSRPAHSRRLRLLGTPSVHTHTNTQTYSCSTVSVHTARTPGVPVKVLSRRLQSGWPSTELFSRENRTDINRLLMGFITSKDAVTQSHLIVVYIVIAGSFSELNISQRGCCHFGQKKFHVRVPTFYERR